ncbi:glycosyltransferase family 69 protein, partial [Heterobasidion irregulare TC 32-1]
GEFDIACALDFDGIGLYDIWVTHDACGLPTKEIWPYFSTDDVAIDNLRKDLPIEVSSCWNGVAAFDARWFLPQQSPDGQLPLQFRDNSQCAASECFLVSYDMHLANPPTQRPRIYINPQVNVAYTPLHFLIHCRLTHLTISRPWRVIWEDLIAHRWFGWVSDNIWLKPDRCVGQGGIWEGVIRRQGCPGVGV